MTLAKVHHPQHHRIAPAITLDARHPYPGEGQVSRVLSPLESGIQNEIEPMGLVREKNMDTKKEVVLPKTLLTMETPGCVTVMADDERETYQFAVTELYSARANRILEAMISRYNAHDDLFLGCVRAKTVIAARLGGDDGDEAFDQAALVLINDAIAKAEAR